MKDRLARGLRILYRFESCLAAVAYAAVALLLLGDVVCRELFGFAIWGAQRIAVYGAIIAAFIGLALATASNSHLRQGIFDKLTPASLNMPLSRAGDALSALIYLVLAGLAVQFVQQSIFYNDQAAVLYIPLWPMQLILPYAFFSSGLRHLAFALYPDLKPQPVSGA